MGSFIYQHRVRNHEVDAQGFMFNSRYLEVADIAFTEFMRKLGWSYPELVIAGLDPSVVSAQLTYSRPARLDEAVDVAVTCQRVGQSSFDIHFGLCMQEHQIADFTLVYVNVDAQLAVARPIPANIRQQLVEHVVLV